MVNQNWISLLPPLIVIGAIFITRRLNISLLLGIFSAGFIAAQGNMVTVIKMCIDKAIIHLADIDNIYLYLLLIIISSFIVVLTVTGSAAGCAQIIGKRMKTKRSVEMSSILLAFLLSIDDYLSILTVGFVMRPIADRVAVARTKLAYIVHALAGPLVIIMPISTWAATILVQLDNAGVGTSLTSKIVADPFYVYIQTIPFVFYSLLLVVSVLYVVQNKIGFGLIYRDECNAVPIYDDNESIQESGNKHSLIELLMPIALLVGGVFFGLLYAGNYHLFGGNNSFVDAFRNNSQTFFVFFMAGLCALLSSVVLSLYKKLIRLKQLPAVVYEGFLLMKSSIVMVMLASILGSFLRLDLHTGSYVASLLLGTAPLCLIPVMIFVVSLVITLTTGSAWGTFSLLIPITVQMIIALLQLEAPVSLEQIPLLFTTLGALLSGAACGNHIAPFAETTIMAATSTGIEPLEHARTQFAYAIPVIISTFISFVVAGLLYERGLLISWLVSLMVGMGVCVILFYVGNRFFKISFE